MSEQTTISAAEWIAHARALFGDDPRNWKFRCPVCGNVQVLTDFEAIGVEPQMAYQECIGRHLKDRASGLGTNAASDGSTSPCDYAAYGLFYLGGMPKVVPDGGGKPVAVFPFAEATGK
jgi:hypothetical protein